MLLDGLNVMKVLCVNSSPAIDRTVVVPGFVQGRSQCPIRAISLPGGKGGNVARVLRWFGVRAVVTGWVGGYSGQFIEDGSRLEGVETAFVHTEHEARTCTTILDPRSGVVTNLYEKAPPVPPSKVEELLQLYRMNISEYSAVTLSGSLPPGVPRDFYPQLIRIAAREQVPTLLDSNGDALRRGIAAGPTLVKPTIKEFAGILAGKPEKVQDLAREVSKMSRRSGCTVVVTLGADGALCAHNDHIVSVKPPRMSIVSAVGSGDSMLAGLAFGFVGSFSLEKALRYGVAAGTANALTLGAGILEHSKFERVLRRLVVTDNTPLLKARE